MYFSIVIVARLDSDIPQALAAWFLPTDVDAACQPHAGVQFPACRVADNSASRSTSLAGRFGFV